MHFEDLRREAKLHYSEFSKGKLIAKSRAFALYTRRSGQHNAEHFHVLEVREVEGQYLAGCVQWVQVKECDSEASLLFKWFDLYKHDVISSAAVCDRYFEKFIADFNGAAEDDRQAGIAHHLEEMKKVL